MSDHPISGPQEPYYYTPVMSDLVRVFTNHFYCFLPFPVTNSPDPATFWINSCLMRHNTHFYAYAKHDNT